MRLLVVNFHYFRDEKPKTGIYPVSSFDFKQQLLQLGKYYRFISQNELCDWISKKQLPSGNCCMITFDDGFKEHLCALDMLKKMSIPAVFYVTTQPITESIAHDTHKLHFIYTKFKDEEIFSLLNERFEINKYTFANKILDDEYRYDSVLKKKIKFFLNFVLSDSQRQEVVNYLFSLVVPNERSFVKNLYMDKNDIIQLARLGMLGTHTHTHRALSSLPTTEIKKEIHESIKTLEELTNTRIRSISYPFGGTAAVDQRVANLAKQAGLTFGLTMNRGINEDWHITDNMLLNRVDTNDAPGGKLKSLRYAL